MITTKNGDSYPTVQDAADEFGVSPKTVYQYIEKGIIDAPPEIDYGLRPIQIFPKSYMADAKKQLEAYKSKRRAERKSKKKRSS